MKSESERRCMQRARKSMDVACNGKSHLQSVVEMHGGVHERYVLSRDREPPAFARQQLEHGSTRGGGRSTEKPCQVLHCPDSRFLTPRKQGQAKQSMYTQSEAFTDRPVARMPCSRAAWIQQFNVGHTTACQELWSQRSRAAEWARTNERAACWLASFSGSTITQSSS